MRKLWTSLSVAVVTGTLVAGPMPAMATTRPSAISSPSNDSNVVMSPEEIALTQWETDADAAGAVAEYRDQETGQMVALMPGGLTAAESRSVLSGAAALGISARVVEARITKARVDAIEGELKALRPKIDMPYRYVVTFDPVRQVVTVRSDAPVSAFTDVLSAYGADVQFETGRLVLQSRTSDSAPHWGGAAIRGTNDDGQLAGCTSGFTARDSGGHNLMVTAGHCFKMKSVVSNFKLVNNAWQGGGASFGSVTARDADGDDEEITGSSYAGTIYTSNTNAEAVHGAGSFTVGATYCVSGAYSGANGATCGHADISNQSFICSSVCFAAVELSGGVITQDGDSGAPWYWQNGSTAAIRGVHVGIIGSHMFATPWTTISGAYVGGLTIVNGA